MARRDDTLRLGDDRLTFLATSADTGGAYVEVAVDYAPAGIHPPLHLHPHQRETMHVLAGTLSVKDPSGVRDFTAGETVRLPPATPHSIWNPGPGHTRIVWRTEPALKTERVFETLWGLADAGKITPDGKPLLQAALLVVAFRDEYRVIGKRPFALDLTLCGLLSPVALALGHRPYHRPARSPEPHRTPTTPAA